MFTSDFVTHCRQKLRKQRRMLDDEEDDEMLPKRKPDIP